MFDYVFVCKGAEFKAVKKGLFFFDLKSKILAIPMGIKAVNKMLKSQNIDDSKSVILVGLGGSLSPDYTVGDVVVYENCSYLNRGNLVTKTCDLALNNYLINKLNCSVVKGLTTDSLIHESSVKKSLFAQTSATVVDMESFAILSYFQKATVLRVISDNYDDNLPDLNLAITPEGKLEPKTMAIALFQAPIKGIKLIKNGLISLKKLEAMAKLLR